MGRPSFQHHAPAIRKLAITKISSAEIAAILNMKAVTVRAICSRSNIALLHPRGKPRIVNHTGNNKVLGDPFNNA